MKKQSQKKVNKVGGRYRIECNFADEVLVPAEAIERAFYDNASPDTDDVFITLDGKVCRPKFLATWTEVDATAMDDFCGDTWGLRFSMVRSLWYDRLMVRDGLKTWHYIRLNELG